MPRFDHVVTSSVHETGRTIKLRALFDVPAQERVTSSWSVDMPIEKRDWNIGLIVGPSGAGKTQILRRAFGEPRELEWSGRAVIDDFPEAMSVSDVASVCSAVGFSTVPNWLKPFGVLSNGEQFRVSLARLLAESGGDVCLVDEFTSVVDRQVAKVASHAVQRHIRRTGSQLVAASCHYDIVDWLQPDWIYEPAVETFAWRSLQRRPAIDVTIRKVGREMWRLFHRHHYMSQTIGHNTACYCLFVGSEPVSFFGLVNRPISTAKRKGPPIMGVSRVVTLPDWQGVGLIMVLIDTVASAYAALGSRVRGNLSHYGLSRVLARSPAWRLAAKPRTRLPGKIHASRSNSLGIRPSAVFEYCGARMAPVEDAAALVRAQWA